MAVAAAVATTTRGNASAPAWKRLPLPRGKRRKLDRLVVKNWNVETLTKNRLVDWLAEQDDACDVAGLTECHGNGRAHADALELGDRYIAGAEATADDAAAGVAILLSPRARAAKINDGRSPCGTPPSPARSSSLRCGR